MSVDSWQPVPQPATLTPEQLNKLLGLASENTDLTPELNWIQPFAQMDKAKWVEVAAGLSQSQMISLIKLFTLAESEGNWDLGDQSAVIPLFKALRKEAGIDKSLVQWVKEHTDNKFLPFGPLM